MPSATLGEAPAPLRGVRVISLAEQYPGPFATMILADLGADVILVERPSGGDPTRRFGGHFTALSRNKRSITLDLKNQHGKEVLMRLLSGADVLIEGFRPGVMARLGLGADEVRTALPDLIYTSISSFGQTGPLSSRAAHDIAVQGMAGYVDGGAAAPLPLGDISAAMFATIGVVSALYERSRTGQGRTIDVAMLDSLLAWRSTALVSELNGLVPAPYPPEDPGYGVFHVGPDRVPYTLSISGEDSHWRELCLALGRSDLAGIPTLEREARAAELTREISTSMELVEPAVLEAALAAHGVTLGRVNDSAAIANDEHVMAREGIRPIEDDPTVRVVGHPVRFDGESVRIVRPSPRLGEHTREILRDCGFDESSINDLIDAGAVSESRDFVG